MMYASLPRCLAAAAMVLSTTASAFGPVPRRPSANTPSGATLFEFTSASQPWTVTNDPVMGGVSNSTFAVVGGVGVWSGEVKIVPYLHAPGTCQSAVTIPSVDASAYDAIEITLVSKAALKQYQASWGGPFVPEPPHSPHYRRHAYNAVFVSARQH